MATADIIMAMTDRLQHLHLVDTAAITLSKPEPDYFLHLDSQSSTLCGSSAKIAATSTNHSVRLYNKLNLGYQHTIFGHEKPLTGVRFSPSDPNLVFSSSLDGTICCWDLRQRAGQKTSHHSDAAVVYEGYDETNNVFTSFDANCDGRLLCAGTESKGGDVHLIFWDCRMSTRLGVYEESHQDDITQVCFHPTQSNRLITASTDGLVCLFDVSESSEDDALIQTFNAESAVNKIGFCGKDDSNIYCITSIESLSVWDTEEFDPIFQENDIKEKLTEGAVVVDYLVDCFHSIQPSENFNINVLAGSNDGTLQVLEVSKDGISHQLTLTPSLEGKDPKGHKALVRCMDWDRENRSLVTGGEDGLVCLWKPEKPAVNKTDISANLKSKTPSKLGQKRKSDLKSRGRKSAKS